ncbi:hypothetical protein TMU3MR103_0566 [Tetragenococcus muriaticus 3MR10-3]|uniref:Uncharacterized protein n=1 Tax=Tetragenococcus muriaticus 3MR10-3 TaxID=1302648 RepID=A0A091C603_9ENTE|nr:hypothetical protein TMU3MR103_0566 [Tetragenococcus muriaticus 3MR10-3]
MIKNKKLRYKLTFEKDSLYAVFLQFYLDYCFVPMDII